MDRRIAKLTGHVILAGYGRVGTQIARLMAARGAEIVVIDAGKPTAEIAAAAGFAIVVGDCTEDDVLVEAGIDRAETLVVSLGDDADAMSTALSARALNPRLRIIARANEVSSEAKLIRAGCDRVVNPLSQGAHRMASFAQQPDVADFVDVVMHDQEVEYELEELQVPAGSPVAGVALGEAHLRRDTGALVLAVRRPDGSFDSIPGPDVRLTAGTTLIAMGTRTQLAALAAVLKVETRAV